MSERASERANEQTDRGLAAQNRAGTAGFEAINNSIVNSPDTHTMQEVDQALHCGSIHLSIYLSIYLSIDPAIGRSIDRASERASGLRIGG